MDASPIQTAREFHRAGRATEAQRICRDILAADPNHASALNLLGVMTAEAGDVDDAIRLISKALEIQPGFADGHNNLAALLKRMGRIDEAMESYQRAVRLDPGQAEIHYNIGNILYSLSRYDPAVEAYRQALRIRPNYADAHNNLGLVLAEQGELDAAIEECRLALRIDPGNPHGYVNLLYALYHHPDCGCEQLLAETRQWSRRIGRTAEFSPPEGGEPARRLRVGYLSSLLNKSADAHFIVPLLANHERGTFEVFCFTCTPREDEITQRIHSLCEHWVDLRGLPPAQAAQVIRERKIDLLISIGPPADTCATIAATRCAPVQMTWLTFSSCTSGLDSMDYRISDPYLDPPGKKETFFSEKTVQLPRTAWCYDPLIESPPVAPLPAIASGFVTFGSLNRLSKINSRTILAWAEILLATPTSRLLILAPPGSHRQRVIDEFETLKIKADRIEFVDRRPRTEYLQQYQRIDISLDTFPFSGHTTALDSLWMGVPVVTLAGRTTVGRAACSALQNLQMPQLITQSQKEYVEIAVRLAGDIAALQEMRSGLRGRMRESPLMDTAGFARDMQQVYRRVCGWEK